VSRGQGMAEVARLEGVTNGKRAPAIKAGLQNA
jgi:hypothetical protein